MTVLILACILGTAYYYNMMNLYPILHNIDGDRGAPSNSVDIQRNRILATAALKKAEPMADQGRGC